MRVKHLDGGQLRDLVLSSEDIDQPVQLHHAKVLASLRTGTRRQKDANLNANIIGQRIIMVSCPLTKMEVGIVLIIIFFSAHD